MSSYQFNDTPSIQSPKPNIIIEQIEVYKIAALAVEVKGFRICLRLKSDRGLAWSEIFVEEQDPPVILDEWKLALKPYVGKFDYNVITKNLAEANNANTFDQRMIYLYTNALHQLFFMPEPTKQILTTDEDVLKKRAIAYFSI